MSRADYLIERLQSRIAELEAQVSGIRLDVITQIDAHAVTRAELAALKAQQPSGVVLPDLIAELKKQADEIAREGHAGWGNTMLLAAEALSVAGVVLPERMTWDGLRATACNIRGEGWNACLDEVARLNASAQAVPDGKIFVTSEALRTVLNALVNAPHQIRELQATREPVALFVDNPINVLIAEYEAAHAAPSAQQKESGDE